MSTSEPAAKRSRPDGDDDDGATSPSTVATLQAKVRALEEEVKFLRGNGETYVRCFAALYTVPRLVCFSRILIFSYSG